MVLSGRSLWSECNQWDSTVRIDTFSGFFIIALMKRTKRAILVYKILKTLHLMHEFSQLNFNGRACVWIFRRQPVFDNLCTLLWKCRSVINLSLHVMLIYIFFILETVALHAGYCDKWTKFILKSYFRFLWEFNENDESEEKEASQLRLSWSRWKEPQKSKKDQPEEAGPWNGKHWPRWDWEK